MEYISHRINTIKELKQIPQKYGVEVDIRDFKGRLILQHDPFQDGQDFEEYLQTYSHNTMILNVKSERIEHEAIRLMQKYNIQKYFLLDSSFPMIHLLSKNDEKNIALRYSELECIETIINMKNKIKWVWVDCFTRLPIDAKSYALLKDCGFKLCLVSPELQGQDEKIQKYKKYLKQENIIFDAICTKYHNIKRWQ